MSRTDNSLTETIGMKYHRPVLVASLAVVCFCGSPCGVAIAAGANPPIIVSNCIEADLRAAVSQGGTIRFDCDGIIKLSTNLVIARDTIIDGTGHDVTISGAGDTRVFWIEGTNLSWVYLTLRKLTIADGYALDGAGVYNRSGSLTVESCVFSNNLAVGAPGSTGATGTNGSTIPPLTAGSDGQDGGPGQQAR